MSHVLSLLLLPEGDGRSIGLIMIPPVSISREILESSHCPLAGPEAVKFVDMLARAS